MQAILQGGRLRLSSAEQRDQSRTESRIITRKQTHRPNANNFKKKKEEEGHIPSRDKRYHSSQQLKFVKHASAEEKEGLFATAKENFTQENIEGEVQKQMGSPLKEGTRIEKKKSLVFNKFTHKEKQQIRDLLIQLKMEVQREEAGNYLGEYCVQIEAYITKLEENNSKLLEVNYFFQKEFNGIMTEKQLAKRVEKCSKNYCMECRYHLEKENRWKQEKIELDNQITRLRQELTSAQSSKAEQDSHSPSIVIEYSGCESSSERSSMLKLREQLQVKDEQYLILLKEFNYLDTINKELKTRMGKVMEEYRYLSIENRTLLNTKTKLIEKEMECTKYKDERDYFKRKLIEHHHRNEQQKQQMANACHCTLKQEDSIFSLSSASNNLSSIDHGRSSLSNLEESPNKHSLVKNTN